MCVCVFRAPITIGLQTFFFRHDYVEMLDDDIEHIHYYRLAVSIQ